MWKRAVLALLALASAPPAAGLDLQSTKAPGRRPPSLGDGEIAINRADRSLFFKNLDGTIGVGSLLNAAPAGRRAIEEEDASGLNVKAPGAEAGQSLSTWMTTPFFATTTSPLNTNAYDSVDAQGRPRATGRAGLVFRSGDGTVENGKERYGSWFVYDGPGTGYPDVIASSFAVGISALKKNWHNTTVPGQTISLHLTSRCGYHGLLKATAPTEFGGYYPGGDCSNIIANGVQSSLYASQSAAELSTHVAENGRFDLSGHVHSINTQINAMKVLNPDGSIGNPGTGLVLTANAGDLGYGIQIQNTARAGTYPVRPGHWLGALRYNRDNGVNPAYDAFLVDQDGGAILGAPNISWAEAWQPGFTDRTRGKASHLSVISPNGRYGISAAVRTSDNKTTDQINVIANNAMVVSDNTTKSHRAWGGYLHCIDVPGALTQGLICAENSVANFRAPVASDPYNLNPTGQTSGLRLSAGVGDGVDYPIPGQGTATAKTVSAAATILANGAKYYTGLQIGAGALDTSLTGGIGHAVQMPVNTALTWQHQASLANVDWRFYAGGSTSAAGPLLAEGAGQFQVGPSGGGKVALQGGATPTVTTTAGPLTLASASGEVVVAGRIMTPAWTGYVPTAVPDGAQTATISATGQYELAGKTLRIALQGNVSAVSGAPSDAIRLGLPPGLVISHSCNGIGRENSVNGKGLGAFGFDGQGFLSVLTVANDSIVANGASFSISATCQVK